MKLDIARQPLVPAFLTLFAFALTVACAGDGEVVPIAGNAARALHPTSGAIAATGLSGPSLQEILQGFLSLHPVWSRIAVGLLILFTGMCIGRLSVRYNLYSVSTCIAIPLFAILACGTWYGGESLRAFTGAALFALSIKNFCRSYSNGYALDALFRASLYLSLTVFILPEALPLLLLLPAAALLFHRTLREVITALAGLLFVPLVLCYINWGAGGDFTAPLVRLANIFLSGVPLAFFAHTPPLRLFAAGVVGGLNLMALFMFLADANTYGNKARQLLLFIICTVVLTTALFCGGAASQVLFPLLATASAVQIPVFFVRINRAFALPLYLLLLAAAFLNTILQ